MFLIGALSKKYNITVLESINMCLYEQSSNEVELLQIGLKQTVPPKKMDLEQISPDTVVWHTI